MLIPKFDLTECKGQKQTMSVIVREERPKDIAGIARVHRDAFETSNEAELVKRLRDAKAITLSFVAVVEDKGATSKNDHSSIVGHILFTPVVIQGEQEKVQAIGLAPMAVLSKFQGQGIGSVLVRTGLEKLRQRYSGYESSGEPLGQCFVPKLNAESDPRSDQISKFVPAVVVLGHPQYYPRFGFQKASTFGIRWEYDAPDEAFMVLELTSKGLEGCSGMVRFHPEFAKG